MILINYSKSLKFIPRIYKNYNSIHLYSPLKTTLWSILRLYLSKPLKKIKKLSSSPPKRADIYAGFKGSEIPSDGTLNPFSSSLTIYRSSMRRIKYFENHVNNTVDPQQQECEPLLSQRTAESFVTELVDHFATWDHEPDLIDIHFFLFYLSELFHLGWLLKISCLLYIHRVEVGDYVIDINISTSNRACTNRGLHPNYHRL